jgi:hypothetical protein
MPRPSTPCPGPLSRREFLRLGSFGLGGIGLNAILGRRARAREAGHSLPDTSVIFLWLPGGPPHLDTYDLKPDAPEEYRGAFKPIRTKVPGLDVCELFPEHARVADKFAIIRSVAHTFADHGGGHKRFLTGREPREPSGFINDYPMVGSMVSKCREQVRRGVPNYILGADGGRDQIDVFSFGSAYLDSSTHPFTFTGDPSTPGFQVRSLGLNPNVASRVGDRLGLLAGLDSAPERLDRGTGKIYRERALDLMMSEVPRKAFDLAREDPRLRDRYGMHVWGQRCLMARRLVEHGASFVTMVLENPFQSGVTFPRDGTYNWDSHAVNCHIFNDAKVRFPLYDRCIAALVEDLYARGLDKKVMLIVTGEFGRTPRVEYSTGTQTGTKQPGRDHWPQAMSILVAGAGLKVGQVVGSTNSKGEHPKDRPMTPNDLWATMFRHLGIDWHGTSFLDHTGRPMPILPYGEAIKELV